MSPFVAFLLGMCAGVLLTIGALVVMGMADNYETYEGGEG